MNYVQVIGMEDINRKLNEFEDKMARKHLKDSLIHVSKPVKKSILSNIRAKIKRRKGKLLRSIGTWFYKPEGVNTIYVGPRTGKRAVNMPGVVNVDGTKEKADAWYAHFLEFGTSSNKKRIRAWTSKLVEVRGIMVRKKIGTMTGYKGTGGGIAARPFMRPAWDQHKGSVLENLRKDLRQRLGL